MQSPSPELSVAPKGGTPMRLRKLLILLTSVGIAAFLANFGGGGGP
jgi:hypothetical protein